MTNILRCLALLLSLSIICLAEGAGSEPGGHAGSHSGDSYVLVLKKQAIMRGADFSQRKLALAYGKKNHLRDFVWFATKDGHFVAADTETIQRLRTFEETQEALNKRWARDAANRQLAPQLRQDQSQHTLRRDEFVWALFNELRDKGRLTTAAKK